jgi:hypothetical protein
MASRLTASILRIGPLVATLVGTWTSAAHATDKVACVNAASEGQKLLRANKLLSARDQLLVCSAKDCPEVVSKDCTEWLGQAQRGIGSVVVKARDEQGQLVEDVRFALDGAGGPPRSTSTPAEVDPGSHIVRVERAGYEPIEQRVDVREGQRNVEVVVALRKVPGGDAPASAPIGPTRPVEAGRGRIPTATWVLGGVGVLGLGSFAFFGLTGKSQQSDLKGSCAPYCTDSDTSPLRTKFLIANISLVTGAVALGAAAVIALVGSSSTSSTSGSTATLPPRPTF